VFLNYIKALYFFFNFYNLIIIIPDNKVKRFFKKSESVTKNP
jgi:hypothetical protein